MKIYKYTATIILVACSILPLSGGNAIAVHLLDGSIHTLLLSQNPKISFSGDDPDAPDVTVSFATDNETLEFKRSEVSFYNFITAEDGIPSQTVTNTPGIKIDDATVIVSGIPEGMPVNVVDMQGRVRTATKADAGGIVNISLSRLPKGVYIINYGTAAVKVTRR